MSHMAVTVCVNDLADLNDALAPFDMATDVEPYRRYLVPWPTKSRTGSGLLSMSGLNPDTATWARLGSWAREHHQTSCGVGELPADGTGCPSCGLEAVHLDADGDAYLRGVKNPAGKWNAWQVGGKFTNMLALQPGVNGLSQVIRRSADSDPFYCDGAAWGLVETARVSAQARRVANRRWAHWQQVTEDLAPTKTLRNLLSEAQTPGQREAASARYFSQPAVQAVKGSVALGLRWVVDPVDEFSDCEKEEFVQGQINLALVGGALLTTDRRWLSPSTQSRPDVSASRARDYARVAADYLRNVDPRTWVLVVDVEF